MVSKKLDAMGFNSIMLHGGKIQAQREAAISGFREGRWARQHAHLLQSPLTTPPTGLQSVSNLEGAHRLSSAVQIALG